MLYVQIYGDIHTSGHVPLGEGYAPCLNLQTDLFTSYQQSDWP